MRAPIAFWVWLAVTTAGSVVHAHVSLDAPVSRYYQTSSKQADQNKLKASPCGATGDSRTTTASLITTFKPGETITVTWRETVQHPGHFRIAFDNDGQDFPFPGDPLPSGVVVLVDNIADKSGANGLTYSQEVTLPNVECSNCTLQLIQVMTTASPPYSKSGDLYFNCADLVLKSAGGTSGAGGAASGGTTGSTSLSNSGGSVARGGATGVSSGGTANTLAAGGRSSLPQGGNSSRGGTDNGSSALASLGGSSPTGGTTSSTSSNGGAPRSSVTLSGGTSASNTSGSRSGGGGGSGESLVATTAESSGGSRNSSSTDNTTQANANGGSSTSGTASNGNPSGGGGSNLSGSNGTDNEAQNATDAPAGCSCRLSGENHAGQASKFLGLGLLLMALSRRSRSVKMRHGVRR